MAALPSVEEIQNALGLSTGRPASKEALASILSNLCSALSLEGSQTLVTWHGAAGDGRTDDAPAILRAIASLRGRRGTVIFPSATYLCRSPIVVAEDGVTLDFRGATLATDADIPVLVIGRAERTRTFSHCRTTGALIIRGAGSDARANCGMVVQNHSYGSFEAATRITGCGGGALRLEAFARGVQYNLFRNLAITGNHNGDYVLIDSGLEEGGYCNDNEFHNIRSFRNGEGGIVHSALRGKLNHGNRFFGLGVETQAADDVLMRIDSGLENVFISSRLDGREATTALELSAEARGNIFIAPLRHGRFVDRSGASAMVSVAGWRGLPVVRLGGAGAGAVAWEIGLAEDASGRVVAGLRQYDVTGAPRPVRLWAVSAEGHRGRE